MSSIANADHHKQQLETFLLESIQQYVKQSKVAVSLPPFPNSFTELSPFQFRLYVTALLNDVLTHEKHEKVLPLDLEESSSMSNVFRICEDIVATFKELGLRSKVTFRDLMHPGEQVVREIFRWLNERLNSFDAVESDQQLSGSDISSREILHKSLLQWKRQWTPPAVFCTEHRRKRVLASHPKQIYFSNSQNISAVINPLRHEERASVLSHNLLDITRNSLLLDEWEAETGGLVSKVEYQEQKLQRVNSRIKNILGQEVEKEVEARNIDELLEKQFTPTTSASLSVLNDKFKSAFANQKFFEMSEEVRGAEAMKPIHETEEQIIERRQSEETEAQEAVEKVISMTQKLTQQVESLKQAEVHLQSVTQEQKVQKKKLQEQYKITSQTYNLFKDRENALPEMQRISSQSAERLLELAKEWERHRIPLLQKYHKLKEELEDRKKLFKESVEALKQRRTNIRVAIQDVKEKDQVIEELRTNLASLPTNLSRNDFVVRIFDIVKNIENQRIEIAKILAESRELQRVIAKISEQLSGTFREAEKKIYEVAEKDTSIADVYANVIQLRNLFESIIKAVQEKGQCITTVRDLETQQEIISKRINENNLEQASKDLEMIKHENLTMIHELKQKKSLLQ